MPLTCSFCVPGGPEHGRSQNQSPVKYTLEAVVVEGQFQVLKDDPYGLYYRAGCRGRERQNNPAPDVAQPRMHRASPAGLLVAALLWAQNLGLWHRLAPGGRRTRTCGGRAGAVRCGWA